MKKTILLLLFPLIGFAQETQFPMVKNFGGIFETPFAVSIVDTSMEYKILVDITEAAEKSETELNPMYDRVAKIMNLHAMAGVPKSKINVVCVIHFKASPTVLSDEGFLQKFKVKNPNTDVIQTLSDNGVKFYVCGQSLIARDLLSYQLNPNIQPIHGALLGLSHFQNLGYALLK